MEKDITFCTDLLNDFFSREKEAKRTWTISETREYFEKVDAVWKEEALETPPPVRYIIHLGPEDGPKIGFFCYFYRVTYIPPEISFVVLRQYQNQGFVTEAGRETMRYWREEIGIKDICALVSDSNVASRKVVAKLGFVRGGHVIFCGFSPRAEKLGAYILPGMRELDGPIVQFVGKSIDVKDETS